MKHLTTSCLTLLAVLATIAQADSFGTGANQFNIEFVHISGSTNPSDTSTSDGYGIVDYDYRMGTCEITNDQWNKFSASLGVPVTGEPSDAYEISSQYTGPSMPTDSVSWYEAAQFVNWLNTSTNHQAAYKFTGTQGQRDYAFDTWSPAEAADDTNLYRHKDAFYFLPTDDEWVKAAYFNGTTLQEYATKADDSLFQGDGFNGGWNYSDGDDGPDGPAEGPWDVGSGSEELNGTYDMMGNVWEWMESPFGYVGISSRGLRSGDWGNASYGLAVSYRTDYNTDDEGHNIGFRVASVPSPSTVTLLLSGLASMLCFRRQK